jgi:hypothetical protein
MTRPLWVAGLPLSIPASALAIYADDDEKIAIVATPTWRVHVVTPEGVIEVPRKIGRRLVREYMDT